jgi:hypothetical protein
VAPPSDQASVKKRGTASAVPRLHTMEGLARLLSVAMKKSSRVARWMSPLVAV